MKKKRETIKMKEQLMNFTSEQAPRQENLAMFLRGFIVVLAVFLYLQSGPLYANAKLDEVKIANVTVRLLAPTGMSRVDGLSPEADSVIKKIEKEFKLDVLAMYANANEWKEFTQNTKGGKAASIPPMAVICTTKKMPKKKYDMKKMRQEFKKYNSWYSAAANNKPMAALLTNRGNAELTKVLGVNVDFKYKTGSHTRRITEGSNLISFAAMVSFKINGKTTPGILTASSHAFGNKLIYSGYFEESSSPAMADEVVARSMQWGRLIHASQ